MVPNPDSSNSLQTLLQRMQYCADPLADTTIETIVGPWIGLPDATVAHSLEAASWQALLAQWAPQWQRLATVTQTFAHWTDNRSITNWRASGAGLPAEIGLPLEQYLHAASDLPPWTDRDKLERAETLFMDYGALSVTLLFCSSLPECYVIPDLAAVLQTTGQLEMHTDYRIRATGAMIFPVMMAGGLTAPDGGGIAQVLKVRLIHATIRNLILRGSPQVAVTSLGGTQSTPAARFTSIVPPLPGAASNNMQQTLFAHGWKTGEDGLPCNQEELAYTLLTFSYVFLRSMRKLGLALPAEDEEAYLHVWNVTGHVLGIARELMADTMEEAEAMFTCMQARGRADRLTRPELLDPRPVLGQALMKAMADIIPFRLLKSFPVLLTRYLCNSATSKDLGLNGPMSWLSQLVFSSAMLLTRTIDWLVRLASPEFSIARLLTRVLGYHLMVKLLMDQTRPLKLPRQLLNDVNTMMGRWSSDPQAPKWMNALEDTVTTKGSWTALPKT